MWVAVLLPCLVGHGLAASSDWARVQSLASGARLQVSLTTHEQVEGRLDHVTSDALYLVGKKQTREVRRDGISRVYLNRKGSWTKGVLIGTAAGAGIGGVVAPLTMEHEIGYGAAVAGTVVLAALIGAGVGYLVTAHGGRTLIYEASEDRRTPRR
jgi:hypothetical protein